MPMSDTDIVERLRWQKRYTHGIVPVTMEDAAKEIERLRCRVTVLEMVIAEECDGDFCRDDLNQMIVDDIRRRPQSLPAGQG